MKSSNIELKDRIIDQKSHKFKNSLKNRLNSLVYTNIADSLRHSQKGRMITLVNILDLAHRSHSEIAYYMYDANDQVHKKANIFERLIKKL